LRFVHDYLDSRMTVQEAAAECSVALHNAVNHVKHAAAMYLYVHPHFKINVLTHAQQCGR
jgi:hypothetical protein